MRGLCGILVLAVGVGCGAPQTRPFDPSRPIETEKGYRQSGELLDARDLWKKLKENPETGSHVRRAEVLDVVSLVFAASGGALIGWPVGEAIAGKPDPMWELAAVGGGLFVVSIPFAIWSVNSRGKAIAVHNAGLGQSYYRLPDSPLIIGKNSVGFAW